MQTKEEKIVSRFWPKQRREILTFYRGRSNEKYTVKEKDQLSVLDAKSKVKCPKLDTSLEQTREHDERNEERSVREKSGTR